MSLLTRRGAAPLTVLGTAAVVALAVILLTDPPSALSGHAYEDVTMTVVWAVLGAVLARRARVLARVFLGVALAATASVTATAYVVWATGHGTPGATAAAWLGGWTWIPAVFLPVTLLPACFPHVPRGRVRLLVPAALTGMAVMAVGTATDRRIQTGADTSVPNPLSSPLSDVAFPLGVALLLASAAGSVGLLVLRTVRARGQARRELVPVAVAVVVTLVALGVASLLPVWGPLIQLAATPLAPAAVTLVVWQYRMYEVELVVRRSVVFAGLTVLVVGGYVLVVQFAAGLLRREPDTLTAVAATGAVALAFQPARAGMQRIVVRWLYGERDDPLDALTDIANQLSVADEPRAAVQYAADRIRQALRVPWVAVEADAIECGSGAAPAAGTMHRIPLKHLDRTVGHLAVAQRTPREPLTARDRELLERLAPPVAAAVAAEQRLHDLRASRERAVVVREDERRRVRRDLHDGVGPLLAALSAHVDVARLRAPELGPLLEPIREIGDDAVAGLRRVIDDLEPLAIDELGLRGAVEQLARRLADGSGVRVEVGPGAPSGLRAAAEVAAHHIAAEAVTNAVRHAGAERVTVDFAAADGLLCVRVRDDGRGIAPDASVGVGLASMRERAAELGGEVTIDTGPTGTLVRAVLPTHFDSTEGDDA